MTSITSFRGLAGIISLSALVLILVVASLSIGQVRVPAADLGKALFSESGDPVDRQIITQIRLPRIATALLAGAALGMAGVLMQALFRNPMADPWSLGLTAGGQLGVACAVAGAAFAGPSALSFFSAFQGLSLTLAAALGVTAAALTMLVLGRRLSTVSLLVVGLMTWFTSQGLVSVIMHFASRAGGKIYSGWNDGNFAGVATRELPILLGPVLFGSMLAILSAKPLSSLLLGETYARSLGVDLSRVRRVTLAATVLLVAPITAYCGPVTFIGLIVPHFARAISGSARVATLLPLATLAGAVLALGADLVVHLPWPQHFLHLNAVLAVVGAPIVVILIVFSPAMRGSR
ncbi:MAG TPA: iron ABC transporter permease [Opitutaceae bacterium]|nr:iron ABC transporter permease [Opitutaceae bacterium]